MLSGHGGVVIGSEMSGDVKKITISNCIFDGTDRGIRIKTARGRGGVVEDIRVNNIIMKDIKESPFVLDMQYAKTTEEPVSIRTPQFKNIHYSNISVVSAKNAGFINGLSEMPIENISFSNIQIAAENGFVIQQAKGISFHDVQITTKNGPSITAISVEELEIDNVKSLLPLANYPVMLFNKVNGAYVHNCWPVKTTGIFIELKGAETKNITIKNNNFSAIAKPVLLQPGVVQNIMID